MNENLSKKVLINFFEEGCKKKNDWRIGTEHEKFGFVKESLEPINYEDIQKIFFELSAKFGWEKKSEKSKVIALSKNNASITLEPGGQIELSGAPLKSLFDTCKEVNTHHDELEEVCKNLDIDFLGMGTLPKWDKEKIKIMPKERYEIMSSLMPKVGSKGLDMMLRTSTIQANFDFSSEDDMKKKIRVSQSLQPVIVGLYANSPFIGGKLTDYMSYRSHIWTKTDNSRCGLLEFIYDESFCFEHYVDYLLDVPMYFIIRDEKYIDMTAYRFRDFYEGRIKSHKHIEPNLSDWKIHITTVFPEVRLKTFIELRSADGGPWSRVCALPAFWTGILYDQDNLDYLWELVQKWKFEDIQKFYENVRRFGLQTKTPDGETLIKFSKNIIDLSQRGLRHRNIVSNKKDESFFLDPLRKIIDSGKSPAETWKKLFEEEWDNNVDMLYKTNYFKVLKDEKI